jgi:hypothetical protein
VILAVGYRVKSARGTQFRQWATAQLEPYLVKGFAMDDERVKQAAGGEYFDELLARIRDIRSSERVFWRKVLDIYATSVDYDPSAEASQRFFAVVQNKMHWAAHGRTAAEVFARRADATRPNMGLTTWTGSRSRASPMAGSRPADKSTPPIVVIWSLHPQYGRISHHSPPAGFRRLVSGRRHPGRHGGTRRDRQGLHGHQAQRLRRLGNHAARVRPAL